MSSSETTGESLILVVMDAGDDAVADCLAKLTEVGARWEIAPDVYAATAKLALDRRVDRVLVDVRRLDDEEMSFFRVAAHYHPSVEVTVPSLEGTAERVAISGARVHAEEVQAIIASVKAGRAPALGEAIQAGAQETATPPVDSTASLSAAPADGPATPDTPSDNVAPPAPPPGEPTKPPTSTGRDQASHSIRLSTDGGPESTSPGPALHDAVRQRMAGDDPRSVRRRPPPGRMAGSASAPEAAPPASDAGRRGEPASSTVRPDKPALSPEEVDALLAGEESRDGEAPDAGDETIQGAS